MPRSRPRARILIALRPSRSPLSRLRKPSTLRVCLCSSSVPQVCSSWLLIQEIIILLLLLLLLELHEHSLLLLLEIVKFLLLLWSELLLLC